MKSVLLFILLIFACHACDRAPNAPVPTTAPAITVATPVVEYELAKDIKILTRLPVKGVLTLNGVKIGDPVSAIPDALITRRGDTVWMTANACETVGGKVAFFIIEDWFWISR